MTPVGKPVQPLLPIDICSNHHETLCIKNERGYIRMGDEAVAICGRDKKKPYTVAICMMSLLS